MRLIDADALLEQMKKRREYVGRPSDPVCLVEDAPTVAFSDQHITINWTPDLDKLSRDVAFRGLNEFSFMGKSIREWVEIILEQTSRRWVSVEDRLPEKNVPVLVWEKQGFTYVDRLEAECAWMIASSHEAIVTHWMPLPEPPEENSDEI